MATLNPDRNLYDEEEWAMLESFEEGESLPDPNRKGEMSRYQELFRAARAAGNYGPVAHDVPYPWSKRDDAKKQPPPLAGDAVSGDNPPHSGTP